MHRSFTTYRCVVPGPAALPSPKILLQTHNSWQPTVFRPADSVTRGLNPSSPCLMLQVIWLNSIRSSPPQRGDTPTENRIIVARKVWTMSFLTQLFSSSVFTVLTLGYINISFLVKIRKCLPGSYGPRLNEVWRPLKQNHKSWAQKESAWDRDREFACLASFQTLLMLFCWFQSHMVRTAIHGSASMSLIFLSVCPSVGLLPISVWIPCSNECWAHVCVCVECHRKHSCSDWGGHSMIPPPVFASFKSVHPPTKTRKSRGYKIAGYVSLCCCSGFWSKMLE